MGSVAISLGYAASSGQVFRHAFRSSFVLELTPIVFVLDDRASVRESLELLIHCEGWPRIALSRQYTSR